MNSKGHQVLAPLAGVIVLRSLQRSPPWRP
jgi:hypothetical protein